MNNTNPQSFISKKIVFPGAYDNKLTASLEMPAHEPYAYALFAHCFTCSKDSLAAVRISRALTQFGIAVLRFDFTGLGGSEGDFANTNFSSNINDLLKAVIFLRENYQAPQLLIGHSLGGAAILAAASQVPEAKAIVTISAPSDPKDIERLFAAKLPDIKSQGEAEVEIAGRKFQIKKQLLEDLERQQLLENISKLKKALLIFHSPQDTIVNIENARAIFDAAKHSKSFISLDGADHLLTRKEDSAYVADVLAAWSKRYIDLPSSQTSAETNLEPMPVIVRESKIGRFTQDIIIGEHLLTADEPVAVGGNDLGPSPYGYLLGSLGACTSITLRMYADFKKIPLERTIVKLNINKVYPKDCENCEDENAMIDHIDRDIELQGNMTPEQRQKLLEIANKCPVHRTLTSKILITTTLVD